MSSLNDSDTFLVNRSNVSYQVPKSELMAKLNDTDLMLVNRGGESYKITGADLRGSLGSETPNLQTVVLSEQTPNTAQRFTDQKFDVDVTATNGTDPVFYSMKAKVFGEIKQQFDLGAITDINLLQGSYQDYGFSGSPGTLDKWSLIDMFRRDSGWGPQNPGGNAGSSTKGFSVPNDGAITYRLRPGDVVSVKTSGGWPNAGCGVNFTNGEPNLRSPSNNGEFTERTIQNECHMSYFFSSGNFSTSYDPRTGNINGVRVNGERITANPWGRGTLTFANSNDFDKISPGDTIVQNGVSGLNFTNMTSGLLNNPTSDGQNFARIFNGAADYASPVEAQSGNDDGVKTTLTTPINNVTGVRCVGATQSNSGGGQLSLGIKRNGSWSWHTPGAMDGSGNTEIGSYYVYWDQENPFTLEGMAFRWRPDGSRLHVSSWEYQINNGNWYRFMDSKVCKAEVISVNSVTNEIEVWSNDPWGVGITNPTATTDFIAIDETEMWLKFDSSGQLVSPHLVSSDPGYVLMQGSDLTEKFTLDFPLLFASGEIPDVILPPGTKMQATVFAYRYDTDNNTIGTTKDSNVIQPSIDSYDIRYVLKNKNETGSGDLTFDSGTVSLGSVDPYTYISIVDNSDVDSGKPRTGYGGPTGGKASEQRNFNETDISTRPQEQAQPGQACIWLQPRMPVSLTVTTVDGSGAVTAFAQTDPGTAKGIPAYYTVENNPAEFTGGTGSDAKFNVGKDAGKFTQILSVNNGGSGYTVGDKLTFSPPPGEGFTDAEEANSWGATKDTLDLDHDVLIHGVGGKGGNSQRTSGASSEGGVSGGFDGNGQVGTTQDNRGTGGTGGVKSATMSSGLDGDCLQNPAYGDNSGGGGGGGGWGGGGGGINNSSSDRGARGGGGGGGGSYLNTSVVTNSSTNNNIDGNKGIEFYLNGSYVDIVISEFRPFLLQDVVTSYDISNASNVASYQAIENSLDSYESDVASFRSDMSTRLAAAGFTQDEITTLGLDN